jgi:hypothetical protein
MLHVMLKHMFMVLVRLDYDPVCLMSDPIDSNSDELTVNLLICFN